MSEDGAHYILVKGLSRITKPAQTLDVIPEAADVPSLSERLSARGKHPVIAETADDEPRDIESSHFSTEKPPQLGGCQEGMKDSDDDQGYGDRTPSGVGNMQAVEVKDSDALPDNGGIKSDANDVQLKDDDTEPRQRKVNKIEVDLQGESTIVLSEDDTTESVNDTSVLHVDLEKATPVERVRESSNERSVDLSDEVKDDGGSSHHLWQQEDTEESSVSTVGVDATEATFHQNSIGLDGRKEECIIERHKSLEMERAIEDDSGKFTYIICLS